MEEPQSEFIRFIQTWIIVYLSLTYAFFVGKLVSPGKIRFLLILPIVCIFLLIPLRLTSPHVGGTTAFFIAWLATFKLILFSFNEGPLSSSSSSSISLLPFLAVGSLPIKITSSSKLEHSPVAKTSPETAPDAPIWKIYAIKIVFSAVLFKLYDFKAQLHPTALMSLYCFHIYLMLEFALAVVGAAARVGLGLELEPQFKEPYKATSLRDFWGRRWNLVVTGILRPTVYLPLMGLLKSILGQNKAQSCAILATFGVSGIMHEYVMYYFNRMYPTGRMSAFFLLHGFCVVAETAVARRIGGKWKVPRMLSAVMTILFVISTAVWLFFPDFLRGQLDVRAFEEYAYLGEFMESVTNGGIFESINGFVFIQHFFKKVVSF